MNLVVTIPKETTDSLLSSLLNDAQQGEVKAALLAYLKGSAEVATKAAALQLGEQLLRQASLTCQPVAEILGDADLAQWTKDLDGSVFAVAVEICLAE